MAQTLSCLLTPADCKMVIETMDSDEDVEDMGVRLLVGSGHSGFGLYVASLEEPGEGSIFLAAMKNGVPFKADLNSPLYDIALRGRRCESFANILSTGASTGHGAKLTVGTDGSSSGLFVDSGAGNIRVI